MTAHSIIYYFSGTGNSEKLAAYAAKALRGAGYETEVICIEEAKVSPRHAEADVIGFCVPVLGFGLPQMMGKFVRSLPRAREGQRAFAFIAVSNPETLRIAGRQVTVYGEEGVCLHQLYAHLMRKGYRFMYGLAVGMPGNWIVALDAPSKEECWQLYKDAEGTVREAIAKFLRGEHERSFLWKLWKPLLGLIYAGFVLLGRFQGGKSFVVTDKCTGCRLCLDWCPQGTIRWVQNRPVWRWNCQQCFRCINRCPTDAIEVSTLAMLAGVGGMIIGWIVGGIAIPHSLPLRIIARIIGATVVSFGTVAVISEMYQRPRFGRFLPQWFITRGKRRHK